MGGLSIWQWLIVLAVVLVLFGTGRVANLMGEFGKGIKSFKNNLAEDQGKDASMLEQATPAQHVDQATRSKTEVG